MKVIIAGSRTITNRVKFVDCVNPIIFSSIASGLTTLDSLEIISGGARGIDTIAEEYAKAIHLKFKKFPANWNKYGKKAGYLRNIEMANYADTLIAIWDGKSKGTKMMIDIAKKKGLKVFVYEVKTKRILP